MANQLIRVVLQQSFLGVVCNNVFHYLVDGVDPNKAQMVAEEFETAVVPGINNIQSVAVTNNQVYAVNVDDFSDFWTESLTGGGIRGAANNSMLRDDAFGFRYTLNPSVIRAGYKRIAGIDKGYVVSGSIASGVLGEVAITAAAISDPLVLNPSLAAIPVVARILDVDPVYVYITAEIIGCIFQRLTSQNTRKT